MSTRYYLKNDITGEEKVYINSASYRAPWRIVRTEQFLAEGEKNPKSEATIRRDAKLAVYATKLGLPVPAFLDAARWLLQKECPFCQLGTKVLERLDELGEDVALRAVSAILDAKDRGDVARLEQIKKDLCPSDQRESPQQS